MSSQVTTPGVYWEQSFSPPVPEFLTGVPAFLGFSDEGEVAQPYKMTLWSQFAQVFGRKITSYLPYAVHGFFGNGGRVCYGMRLNKSIPLDEALEKALQALAIVDAIDLICVPDLAAVEDKNQRLELQSMLLKHCGDLGDRFAILDAPENSTVDAVKLQQQQLSLHSDSHNGALYYPWVQVQQSDTLPARAVPPCGHIAGIYTQSDLQVGVHKAPANVVLEGVVDLTIAVSNSDQMSLSPEQEAGTNCLRVLPGRGIRVWGARTLSQKPEWRYVNVRRLFLTVGRWVDRNLMQFAFEPNNLLLWIRIERELTAYLETLLAQGALQGNSPAEAFYVKCNEETNPKEVRDRGMVITEIGLAPTIPSEFIIIRLIQGETGVTLA